MAVSNPHALALAPPQEPSNRPARPVPAPPPRWPHVPVLGIPLALIDYERTMDWMDATIAAGERGYVCVAAVHTVMGSEEDPSCASGARLLPDPARRPAARLGAQRARARLEDRVYGPELMARYCARSAQTGTRMYLYGGRNRGALTRLANNLRAEHPGLRIVGGYSPPFRHSTTPSATGSPRTSSARAPTSSGSGSASPSRRSGWPRCAPAERAGADRGRRGVRLPRRARAAGAATGCSPAGSSGRTGWDRSHGGCGVATCATTRASCRASRASTHAAGRPPPERGVACGPASDAGAARRHGLVRRGDTPVPPAAPASSSAARRSRSSRRSRAPRRTRWASCARPGSTSSPCRGRRRASARCSARSCATRRSSRRVATRPLLAWQAGVFRRLAAGRDRARAGRDARRTSSTSSTTSPAGWLPASARGASRPC